MTNTKEIKSRIESVKDTEKITNAMYLISSSKLRKAKNELDKTRPYFEALQKAIRRIFLFDRSVDNIYFFPPEEKKYSRDGTCGILVLTAEKGLAGAYNHNVLKEAAKIIEEEADHQLFVVGEFGKQYYTMRKIPIEKSFLYSAQNPTLNSARLICQELLSRYREGTLRKLYIVYTDFSGGTESQTKVARLLPLHRSDFYEDGEEVEEFEFEPSLSALLDTVVPSYLTGFIYSALVDSFCSEQNARMMAMHAATQNAERLADKLNVQYHHIRQGTITQEITEISSGARSIQQKKHHFEEE